MFFSEITLYGAVEKKIHNLCVFIGHIVSCIVTYTLHINYIHFYHSYYAEYLTK